MVIRLKSLQDLITLPLGIAYNLISENKRQRFVDKFTSFATIFLKKTGKSLAKIVDTPSMKNHPATSLECRYIKHRIERSKPSVVIANYAWLAQIFDTFNDDLSVLKVVLAHDVIHQRTASAEKLRIQWGNFRWTREKEKSILSKADVILTIQKEDCAAIQQMLPDSKVLCMPMALQPRKQRSPQIPGRCLFVGSKGYTNVQGLQWLLDEVWPRILSSAQHSSLHVCGTVCNEISGDHAQVKFLGRVEHLAPEYGSAEVCFAPLLFGSGLKIKVIEALSYGRACVATDFGLQGLDELTDKVVLRANTAEEFAKAVTTILKEKNTRLKMEKEAERFARENLSPVKVYQPIVDLIHRHVFQSATR